MVRRVRSLRTASRGASLTHRTVVNRDVVRRVRSLRTATRGASLMHPTVVNRDVVRRVRSLRTASHGASVTHPTVEAETLCRPLPAEPVDDRLPHHELEIAAFEPRHLFGEHRDALAIRDRHARD